jgi:hypothetical protein
MIIRVASLTLLLSACGGGAKPPTQSPKPAAPSQPAGEQPTDSLAPKGEDVDRLCTTYVESKHDGEWDGEGEKPKLDPGEVAACKQMMDKHTAAERQQIADCANSCGAADGVVDCFDSFGTARFQPNCGNDADDDGDDAGRDPDDDGDDQ